MKTKDNFQFISKIEERLFGLMPNGEAIYAHELVNENGFRLEVLNYGATISALKIPLSSGKIVDVVLGFDTLDSYIKSFDLVSAPYFGSTVGRFAGRIKDANFHLNGERFELNKNNNSHSLHGGIIGFSQKVWKIKTVNSGKNPSITLTYTSPDLEENYPGELHVELTYTLTEENELSIKYVATTTKHTIVNLTHHSYFNLEGHTKNIVNQDLFVNSAQILETSSENIPSGKLLDVANDSFDFSTAKKCPSKIDNTFVLDKGTELAALLFSKKNKLKMLVYTNQPAVHIYVGGNCFNQIKGKNNSDYHPLSGICFETQNFPDAPNHDHFPNSVLKKGEVYHHKTIYKFQTY